jgi:hypothetical protein
MHNGLSDVQFLKEPGDVVRAGVMALGANIGGGLGGLSIDNSPVNTAINSLMAGIAAQVYNARLEASTIIADASAAARAQSAQMQLQTAATAASTVFDPIAAFNAAYQGGDYDYAAMVAHNAGYSADQIGQYVEQNYNVPSAQVVDFMRLKGYAAGGKPDAGMYIAHENELIVNGGNDFVFNKDQTRQILSNSGSDEAVKMLAKEIEELKEIQRDAANRDTQFQIKMHRLFKMMTDLAEKNEKVGPMPARVLETN